jgi:hypothetical protein
MKALAEKNVNTVCIDKNKIRRQHTIVVVLY